MTSPTLLVAGLVSILTGTAFGIVARNIRALSVSAPNRPAQRGHVAWWLCLGAYLVLQGALSVVASFGALSTNAYYASRVLSIPLLCAAVWGITFYLAFLFTGRRNLGVALAIVYVIVCAMFYWVTFAQANKVLVVHAWLIEVDDSAPLYKVIYFLVGMPPILSSLAYLTLLRRVQDAAQRRRILLIAGSILAYIGSGLVARLAANDITIFVTLVVFGGGAAIMSLLAYGRPGASHA